MREFVRLSSQEVLFRTQVQSTSHELLASGRPDHFTMYYKILQSDQQSSEAKDKAMEEILNKVSEAWLKTNATLFKHVLDYEAKLDTFLNKTGGWIREQEEHIWTKMFEITGDAGAPLCTSLNIMLCLLDTLPSFPANLSYQSNSPIICGFAPEAYAPPWLGLHGVNLACLPSFESRRKATCFEGGYHPEYRRWGSLHSEGRSVRLHLHSTHTDRERCRCTPAHFFLCSPLSIQT